MARIDINTTTNWRATWWSDTIAIIHNDTTTELKIDFEEAKLSWGDHQVNFHHPELLEEYIVDYLPGILGSLILGFRKEGDKDLADVSENFPKGVVFHLGNYTVQTGMGLVFMPVPDYSETEDVPDNTEVAIVDPAYWDKTRVLGHIPKLWPD